MNPITLATREQVDALLDNYPAWNVSVAASVQALRRTFRPADNRYEDITVFTITALLTSQKLKHHAGINVLSNLVELKTTTWDVNGLTNLDLEWVEEFERSLGNFPLQEAPTRSRSSCSTGSCYVPTGNPEQSAFPPQPPASTYPRLSTER